VWLVTDQLPRQLLRPQAVAGEETGHGRQGSLLGSAGTRGQTCDVDSDGMPGGVLDGTRGEIVGDGWEGLGLGHGPSLARRIILIGSSLGRVSPKSGDDGA